MIMGKGFSYIVMRIKMNYCKLCGNKVKPGQKYCQNCLDACEEEYDDPNDLRPCTVCGHLTKNYDWTCDVCRELVKEEKKWMEKRGVR